MATTRQSESDLLSEESNELLVVQHPVIVLVHHGYELLRLGDGAGHPAMLCEYLGELLAADPSAAKEFNRTNQQQKTKTTTYFPSLSKMRKASLKSCSGSLDFLTWI